MLKELTVINYIGGDTPLVVAKLAGMAAVGRTSEEACRRLAEVLTLALEDAVLTGSYFSRDVLRENYPE